jgi:hypothetical protein
MGNTFNPFLQSRVRLIKENTGYDRVLLIHDWYVSPYNIGSLYEIYNINSYQPMTLARYTNFFFQMVERPSFDSAIRSGLIHDVKEFLQDPQFLGLTSLKYVLVQKKLFNEHDAGWKLIYERNIAPVHYVYENIHALPRAYLVGNYVVTRDEQESFRAMRDNISRLSHMVVLENGRPSFDSADADTNPGIARITDYKINRVDLDVKADARSLLVFTDSHYAGWNAYVDGIKTPVWRANALFRAVEVPPGSHRVTFRYQPASLRWGGAVSLSTLFLVVVGIAIDQWYTRRKISRPACGSLASGAGERNRRMPIDRR